LLGGWRNVLFLYGGIAILVSLIWWFGVKEPAPDLSRKPEKNSFGRTFVYLLRLKSLWIVGLTMLAFQGCVRGMQGFLPYFLEDKGWTAVAASGALAVYNGAGALFVIPLTLMSDKIGSRKIPLTASFLVTIAGVALLSVVHNWLLWILVFVSGALFPLASALFTAVTIELKEVGPSYAGTGVGLMLAIAFIGRAFAPPIGNSLADISSDFGWPFIFWAALGLAGFVLLGFMKETGYRSDRKKS
jgi:cyanate permease